MAMLGLRSLYFVVSDAVYRLRYLRQGLAGVLVFTGVKMLADDWVHVNAGLSVAIIGACLSRRLPHPYGRRARRARRNVALPVVRRLHGTRPVNPSAHA
jgi:tellurite resistance protein TerC